MAFFFFSEVLGRALSFTAELGRWHPSISILKPPGKRKGSLEFTWKCLFLNKAQVTFLLQCLSKSAPHRIVICSTISFFTLVFLFLHSHQKLIWNLYYILYINQTIFVSEYFYLRIKATCLKRGGKENFHFYRWFVNWVFYITYI